MLRARAACFLTALLPATAAHASHSASTLCQSNQGTGYVQFADDASSATLYLDGTAQFEEGLPLLLTLPCEPDLTHAHHHAWVCVEAPPFAHPDGPTSLSVQTSNEYYLMIATRDSKKYLGEIVVDDFDCLNSQAAQ